MVPPARTRTRVRILTCPLDTSHLAPDPSPKFLSRFFVIFLSAVVLTCDHRNSNTAVVAASSLLVSCSVFTVIITAPLVPLALAFVFALALTWGVTLVFALSFALALAFALLFLLVFL